MERNLIITVIAAVVMALPARAQSEGGLLLSAGAEKKVNRKLSVGIDADFRTRNNFKTADRWSGSLGAEYKLSNWLKAEAGYTLLYSNNREDISYNHADDGTVTGYNNWQPSYWSVRHRMNASLTADYKLSNNLHFSLRERWQYTYRPEKTVTRWDFDNSHWEDKVRNGKGKNQLRSRLQVEYDKKRAKFKPYVSIELYNNWSVEKVRYTVGTDVKLSKKHAFDVFYRFQNAKNPDEDEYDPDMHYIGIGYKLKL